jgi:putative transposase
MVVTRRDVYVPKRPNQAWAMDFVSDQLTNGERFRALTIVDVFTRESLAIEAGRSLRADHVIEVCNRIAAIRGAPVRVFVDNGSEFSGRLIDLWAYHHKVRIDFSRPGKPTDNCFIETFNGSLRDECRMCIGSNRLTTRKQRSKLGDTNTMRVGLTRPY